MNCELESLKLDATWCVKGCTNKNHSANNALLSAIYGDIM